MPEAGLEFVAPDSQIRCSTPAVTFLSLVFYSHCHLAYSLICWTTTVVPNWSILLCSLYISLFYTYSQIIVWKHSLNLVFPLLIELAPFSTQKVIWFLVGPPNEDQSFFKYIDWQGTPKVDHSIPGQF